MVLKLQAIGRPANEPTELNPVLYNTRDSIPRKETELTTAKDRVWAIPFRTGPQRYIPLHHADAYRRLIRIRPNNELRSKHSGDRVACAHHKRSLGVRGDVETGEPFEQYLSAVDLERKGYFQRAVRPEVDCGAIVQNELQALALTGPVHLAVYNRGRLPAPDEPEYHSSGNGNQTDEKNGCDFQKSLA